MVKKNYYAVRRGRDGPAIYMTWDECRRQVDGYPGAQFKGFTDLRAAQDYLREGGAAPSTAPLPTPVATNARAMPPSPSAAPIPTYSSSNTSTREMYASGEWPGAPQYVYTDGSSINNGRGGAMAGIGIVWGNLEGHAERLPGDQTNNRAELFAIIRALELDPHPTWPMHLFTDSDYAIKSLTEWHRTWQMNGWRTADGQPVKNASMIKYALALLHVKDFRCNGDFGLHKIEAHSCDPYNDWADRLAKQGATMPAAFARNFDEDLRRLNDSMSWIR